jgi:hypothetical protein
LAGGLTYISTVLLQYLIEKRAGGQVKASASADTALDAARDVYSNAFHEVFGPEITVEFVSVMSDGETHWEFMTKVPRTLYDNVEHLLDLENKAHERVRSAAPDFLGYFSFQYSPDNGETSRPS